MKRTSNDVRDGEDRLPLHRACRLRDRIITTINLAEIGEHTLHWNCKAKNALTGAPVSEGRATRVYARINEDGSLKAARIPPDAECARGSAI